MKAKEITPIKALQQELSESFNKYIEIHGRDDETTSLMSVIEGWTSIYSVGEWIEQNRGRSSYEAIYKITNGHFAGIFDKYKKLVTLEKVSNEDLENHHFECPSDIEFIGCIKFDDDSTLISITLPEGVKKIEPSAFSGCTTLSRVVLPKSLEAIGPCAFSDCSALMSITLLNGVETIGPYAFGDSALISITLPESVTTIGDAAFINCPLSYLIIDSSNPKEIERIQRLVRKSPGIDQIQVIEKPEAIEHICLVREALTKTDGIPDPEKLIEDRIPPIVQQTCFLRFFNSMNETESSSPEFKTEIKPN